MTAHIDMSDPQYAAAAAAILHRHENLEPEANTTSAVRDFLLMTGLAHADEMAEENPPGDELRYRATTLPTD